MQPRHARALDSLETIPSIQLAHYPTPIEELLRLRAALGGGPRLLIKRDDTISFALGGNKVRKAEIFAARALAEGADTIITVGGLQSNHCRVTAAMAAKLGLKCLLVINGVRPERPFANTLLDLLLGAEIEYVVSREEREPAMRAAAERLRSEGRRPLEIPLGASTPLGAVAFTRAIGEVLDQIAPPDVIVHSSSSAGTQAGLVAGCGLLGLHTRVIGISADEPAGELQAKVKSLVTGIGDLLGTDGAALAAARPIEVDDRFVGPGYGIASSESIEAQQLIARTEAIVVDHTYTAKALAGLIALVRERRFRNSDTVLFWHTGGQVGVFA
jgi:1-aminocyclopropane-1-carboxylate deaminase/D-cysteine desulfhydrase-like pyridoxal-dependent ACC family enzyme